MMAQPGRGRPRLRITGVVIALAAIGGGAVVLARGGESAQTGEPQKAINGAYARFKGLREGKNADYIPVLAKVDPDLFGIALVTTDGKVVSAGDIKSEVSIQSIAKVFTMARVIEDSGEDVVRSTVGVDATGHEFNSIVAVERHEGKEMNPMVNAGAIAMTSMVRGKTANDVWNAIIGTYDAFAGRKLSVDQEVYRSESASNERNRAIAMLMHAYGVIKEDPDEALDLYTRQSAVAVNVVDLATMAATLANGGVNPRTGVTVLSARHVPAVLAVMATAGLYDDSGQWLYETGLPAKSGVGGGILAVSPGRFGVAAISPPLDPAGNSVRAQRAIDFIEEELDANPYAVRPVRRQR
jgi:glutaminase